VSEKRAQQNTDEARPVRRGPLLYPTTSSVTVSTRQARRLKPRGRLGCFLLLLFTQVPGREESC
jgi:hypothetical protein